VGWGDEGEPLSLPFRSWPFGLIALALVAAALYVPLLATALYKPAGGGEALMAQAFEMLFLAGGLWIVLALMLLVGGLMGAMPRWVAWLAIVLVPMAAVADVTALDMCSRHMEGAIVLVAALPALVAFYAFRARLRPKAVAPAGPTDDRTSALVWGAIFFLSVATFVLAAY